jgi:acyl carrier protein
MTERGRAARQELEQDLRAIIAEHAGTDVSALGLDEDLVKALGLDSLAGLRLLARVEKRFDVHFPDARLSHLRTLRLLLDELASGQKEGSR